MNMVTMLFDLFCITLSNCSENAFMRTSSLCAMTVPFSILHWYSMRRCIVSTRFILGALSMEKSPPTVSTSAFDYLLMAYHRSFLSGRPAILFVHRPLSAPDKRRRQPCRNCLNRCVYSVHRSFPHRSALQPLDLQASSS